MNILFFGHHKCATTWMRRIFRAFAEKYHFNFEAIGGKGDPLSFEHAKGTVTMYVNATILSARNALDSNPTARAVHVFRDFRDALVSQYWSWKLSHPPNFKALQATRPVLLELPEKDGMLYIIENRHLHCAEQLADWPSDESPRIRNIHYETFLADAASTIGAMFEFLTGGPLPADWVRDLAEQTAFKQISGREQGIEDTQSHYRKGVAGDWRNYFDDDLKRRFKDVYGHLLIEWGYETSNDW